MAILDTSVVRWFSANLDNGPSDSQYIGTDLAGQFRNLRSAYRTFSLNKNYERPDLPQSASPAGAFGFVVFYISGNALNEFQANRKIFARKPTGEIAPGAVADAEFVFQSSPYTKVTAFFWDAGAGAWSESFSELMVAVDRSSPEVFPFNSMGGVLRFKDTETTQEVSFAAANATTTSCTAGTATANEFTIDRRAILSDKTYMVHLSPCFSNAGTDNPLASVVKKVTKDYNKFSVEVFNAPGTDKVVMFDWFITRPLEAI